MGGVDDSRRVTEEDGRNSEGHKRGRKQIRVLVWSASHDDYRMPQRMPHGRKGGGGARWIPNCSDSRYVEPDDFRQAGFHVPASSLQHMLSCCLLVCQKE